MLNGVLHDKSGNFRLSERQSTKQFDYDWTPIDPKTNITKKLITFKAQFIAEHFLNLKRNAIYSNP